VCKLAMVCIARGISSAKGVGKPLEEDNRKELASMEEHQIQE
jgi:hypothetical protein